MGRISISETVARAGRRRAATLTPASEAGSTVVPPPWRPMTGKEVGPADVGAEDAVEDGRLGRRERPGGADPGMVDEDVEAAGAADGGLPVAHVAGHGLDIRAARAEAAREFRERSRGERVHDGPRTLGDAIPDSAAPALEVHEPYRAVRTKGERRAHAGFPILEALIPTVSTRVQELGPFGDLSGARRANARRAAVGGYMGTGVAGAWTRSVEPMILAIHQDMRRTRPIRREFRQARGSQPGRYSRPHIPAASWSPTMRPSLGSNAIVRPVR